MYVIIMLPNVSNILILADGIKVGFKEEVYLNSTSENNTISKRGRE